MDETKLCTVLLCVVNCWKGLALQIERAADVSQTKNWDAT